MCILKPFGSFHSITLIFSGKTNVGYAQQIFFSPHALAWRARMMENFSSVRSLLFIWFLFVARTKTFSSSFNDALM
jgi:hypothetical protein